jgi:hypothetical protein
MLLISPDLGLQGVWDRRSNPLVQILGSRISIRTPLHDQLHNPELHSGLERPLHFSLSWDIELLAQIPVFLGSGVDCCHRLLPGLNIYKCQIA